MPYFIVEYNYVGLPDETMNDPDTIVIRSAPEKNRIVNDFSSFTHGEYETLEAARNAIHSIFGDVRFDEKGLIDENDIEAYKLGKYVPMSYLDSVNWIYQAMIVDVMADTSDEKLDELVEEYEQIANDNGYSLHKNIVDALVEYRDSLKEE